MLRILSILLITVSALHAVADDLSIVDVRRNITLADDDTVYKDFYLAGSTGGLKKNLVVTAVRKISVRDASGSQAFGEIQVPVGQLRIIAIYGKLAVAREYKLLSRDELPMLEQVGIMTGDKIDLQGSFVDSKPATAPKPRHHASELPPTEAPFAVAMVTAPVSAAAAATPSAAPATAPAAATAPPGAPSATPAPPAGFPPVPVTTLKTPPEPAKGPAPASVAPPQAPATAPTTPAAPPAAVIPAPQKLEKTANSGENTAL